MIHRLLTRTTALMAGPTGQVIEGVLAINKPAGISSAQVLRDLQKHFDPSKTFAPWIAEERSRLEEIRKDERRDRYKRKHKAKKIKSDISVKIGHGGTLDPMATGVLVTGIGQGTKSLNGFLDCTKVYEAVILFGAATDTYDTKGKVVAREAYKHITEEKLKEALGKFRGKIMQRPPLYSALRINGKRGYEYARSGKPLPREFAERPVEVKELEMVEWLDGGSHEYIWPAEEAEADAQAAAAHLLDAKKPDTDAVEDSSNQSDRSQGASPSLKRKRGDTPEEEQVKATKMKTGEEPLMSGALQPATNTSADEPSPSSIDEQQDKPSPPAAKIRMVVTSGFYVRSLCHDLGIALGSLAIMADLVRTRQGKFELGQNVLEYDDLAKGEDTWGPQILDMLDQWDNGTTKIQDKKSS